MAGRPNGQIKPLPTPNPAESSNSRHEGAPRAPRGHAPASAAQSAFSAAAGRSRTCASITAMYAIGGHRPLAIRRTSSERAAWCGRHSDARHGRVATAAVAVAAPSPPPACSFAFTTSHARGGGQERARAGSSTWGRRRGARDSRFRRARLSFSSRDVTGGGPPPMPLTSRDTPLPLDAYTNYGHGVDTQRHRLIYDLRSRTRNE